MQLAPGKRAAKEQRGADIKGKKKKASMEEEIQTPIH